MTLYTDNALGGGRAVALIKDAAGKDVKASVVVLVDQAGNATGSGVQETLSLVANSVVAAGRQAYGGNYQARAFASNWAGASAKLQFLDADGATWTDFANADGSAMAPFTANRTQTLALGSYAQIRVLVTGAPTGLFINASRQP